MDKIKKYCPFCGSANLNNRVTSTNPEPSLERNDSAGVSILSLAGISVDEAIISKWSDEQYWQAIDWAAAVYLEASDNADVEIPKMPEFLEEVV